MLRPQKKRNERKVEGFWMGNIMKDLIGTGQYMQFVYEMTYKYVWRFYYFVVFLSCTSLLAVELLK